MAQAMLRDAGQAVGTLQAAKDDPAPRAEYLPQVDAAPAASLPVPGT